MVAQKLPLNVVLFVVIFFLVGLGVGYAVGTISALSFCVDTGFKFLAVHNVSIGIESGELIRGVWLYKNRIGEI